MNDLLKISNLTRTYGKKKVLDGLDLTIGTGKIVGLLAPNGEGKTTLFRLLMGLLTKNDGEILIDGLEPSEVTNSYVSFLPDHYVLGGFHSIRGAMKHMKKYFPDFDEEKALSLMKRLKFKPNQRLASLSKGQKEQVQLILFLSRKAKLFLLDEPLAAVDPATRDFIVQTILGSFGEDNTVIISTHVVLDIELILDEVVMLKNGKVHLQGEADELRSKYGMTINDIFKEEFRFVEGGSENE
ncbi:MAG: ABC transporter ATP-binding protein [Clostridiales bacterium]|nr:ABC transporter ATP-binding protein [Clostridiales bacterium]MBR6254494.1 ABC transporter ATP-binding protein [Clostridiales bacterium]